MQLYTHYRISNKTFLSRNESLKDSFILPLSLTPMSECKIIYKWHLISDVTKYNIYITRQILGFRIMYKIPSGYLGVTSAGCKNGVSEYHGKVSLNNTFPQGVPKRISVDFPIFFRIED